MERERERINYLFMCEEIGSEGLKEGSSLPPTSYNTRKKGRKKRQNKKTVIASPDADSAFSGVSHPSCFLGNQHPASRTVCLNSEEGGMQPMSTHPLISCLSDDAAALCWGVNVAKTESPEACLWDSISNELFLLTEGPDPLRTLLVRALSSFLFLFKPWVFFWGGGLRRGCPWSKNESSLFT